MRRKRKLRLKVKDMFCRCRMDKTPHVRLLNRPREYKDVKIIQYDYVCLMCGAYKTLQKKM